MNHYFKVFFIVSFLVLLFDFIWIKLVMKREYINMINIIQNSSLSIRFIPVVLSYLTIILPIIIFVLPNIKSTDRLQNSIIYGGLMGFFMYGMFSFTNYALLDKWKINIVFLDVLWGIFLYTIVSYISSLFS